MQLLFLHVKVSYPFAASFRSLKVDLPAPEQFQVNVAELRKQSNEFIVILDTLGNLVFIRFRNKIQPGLPIVIRRDV